MKALSTGCVRSHTLKTEPENYQKSDWLPANGWLFTAHRQLKVICATGCGRKKSLVVGSLRKVKVRIEVDCFCTLVGFDGVIGSGSYCPSCAVQ